jgi:hypothetical protein
MQPDEVIPGSVPGELMLIRTGQLAVAAEERDEQQGTPPPASKEAASKPDHRATFADSLRRPRNRHGGERARLAGWEDHPVTSGP